MLPFQLVEYTSDGGCLSVGQLEYKLLPAVSLRQRQQDMAGFGLADDQIHLPVPALRPLPDVCWSVLYAGHLRVRYPRHGLLGLDLLFPLLPEVTIAQLVKDLLVYVAVQCADAYPRSKRVLPCRRQSCRRGVPVHDDLVLDVGGKGVVAADLQRPAFGRLVVAVYLLAFLCRVPFLVPEFTGMHIAAPPKFVVDRPFAEAQLPRDLPHWYLVPPHGFQLVALLLRHVVLLSHLPVPPQ